MASTTIVPFSTLPACATSCYHLYDANGACVPPAVATADVQQYGQCFCSNAYLTPFATGTAGVCDQACTLAAETNDLASIRNWYTSFCASVDGVVATTATSGGASTGTGTGTSKTTSTGKSSSSAGSGTGGSWLDTHWRWVIFIVVVVVGIVGIWIGACVWHRRYLRRKDRQYALDNMRASTGASSNGGGNNNNNMVFSGAPSQHDVAGVGGAPYTPDAAAVQGMPAAVIAGDDAAAEKRRSNVLGRRHK